MRRLAAVTAAVVAATGLAACSKGATVVSNSSAATSRGPVSFSTEAPKPYYSQGVVIANDKGRKVVLDPALPVFDPPLSGDTVEQGNWPVAGRLYSIKELIGVFPDAYTIALNPQGPSKVQIAVKLPNSSEDSTITTTITAVGTEEKVLGDYDSQRRGDQSIYTGGDGKPNSGRVYYKDGAFKTQRLSRAINSWTVVIGNGRTAMQLKLDTDNFTPLSDNFDSDQVLQGQVMPLIMQLLAARM
ncbi:hypothetical protein HJ588_13365 [Flexivirga sp. ID2601S]|uniref:Lipoprotein n=1 Tax=Flexivirga aerilata TaxID=1656889 RepID=A0A849AL51_9MICO|nr:hypothetical protein [Flexivirga aerilata]NNG40256.1 hypothetical protein [Flexivirga aerilata]